MLINNPPVEVADNLLMLATNEYPLFLYKGASEGTIFEGGVGAMGPLVLQQLQQLDISRDFINQVVITHAHPDHVMAVPLLRKAFGQAEVLASQAAAGTLAAQKAIAFFSKVDGMFTQSLTEAGLITEDHHPEPLTDQQIPVDRVIKEGDSIDVDEGVSFAVLETPGHSDCSLSFHQGGSGILIVSDATGYYLPRHDFWWPNYFTGYEAYLASMQRLQDLGAEVLCLSHNGVIKGAEDVSAYFSGAISATRNYHCRIVDEAGSGRPVQQIAEQLGAEVYEKTQLLALEFFQKNCSLLVKQSLRHEGMVAGE